MDRFVDLTLQPQHSLLVPRHSQRKMLRPRQLKRPGPSKNKNQEPMQPEILSSSQPIMPRPWQHKKLGLRQPKVSRPSQPIIPGPWQPKMPGPSEFIVPEPFQPKMPEPRQPKMLEPREPRVPEQSQPKLPRPRQPKMPGPRPPKMPRPSEFIEPEPIQPKMPKLRQPKMPRPRQSKMPRPSEFIVPGPIQTQMSEPWQPKMPGPSEFIVPEPIQPKIPKPRQPKMLEPREPGVPEPSQPKMPRSRQPKMPRKSKMPRPSELIVPEPIQTKMSEPWQPKMPGPSEFIVPEPTQPKMPEPRQPKMLEPREPRVPEPSQPKMPRSRQPKMPRPRQPKMPKPSEPKVPQQTQPKISRRRQPKLLGPSISIVSDPSQPEILGPRQPIMPGPRKSKVPRKMRRPREPKMTGSSEPTVLEPSQTTTRFSSPHTLRNYKIVDFYNYGSEEEDNSDEDMATPLIPRHLRIFLAPQEDTPEEAEAAGRVAEVAVPEPPEMVFDEKATPLILQQAPQEDTPQEAESAGRVDEELIPQQPPQEDTPQEAESACRVAEEAVPEPPAMVPDEETATPLIPQQLRIFLAPQEETAQETEATSRTAEEALPELSEIVIDEMIATPLIPQQQRIFMAPQEDTPQEAVSGGRVAEEAVLEPPEMVPDEETATPLIPQQLRIIMAPQQDTPQETEATSRTAEEALPELPEIVIDEVIAMPLIPQQLSIFLAQHEDTPQQAESADRVAEEAVPELPEMDSDEVLVIPLIPRPLRIFMPEFPAAIGEEMPTSPAVRGEMPTSLYHFDWTVFPTPPNNPLLRREKFVGNSGPKIKPTSNPYETFIKIWDRPIMEHIAHHTNLYAQQCAEQLFQTGLIGPSSRITTWKDTDVDELYVFFALTIAMGIVVKTKLEDYWIKDQNIFSTPGFPLNMSLRRFQLLSRCLHFNDNSLLSPNMDRSKAKLFKIQPIFDHLNSKFSSLYSLGQDIALDESLTQWKGMLEIRQFIPNKVSKVGIKTYEVCESRTGYLWRFEVHAGSETQTQTDPQVLITGAIPNLVLRLLRGLEHRGHTVWMDNYYNSPSLARLLKTMGFDCVGTLRTNRQFVPEDLNNLKKSDMTMGQICGYTSGDVDVMVWRDQNRVGMISTYHGNAFSAGKPTLIQDYNVCMGGVDKKDQMVAGYPMERKRTQVWYKKFFRRLLNVSILNAYIIYKSFKDIEHRQFRMELVKGLLERHQSRQVVSMGKRCGVPRFSADVLAHFPTELPPIHKTNGTKLRRKCVYCKTKRTHFVCNACNVALCFGTNHSCYTKYHT